MPSITTTTTILSSSLLLLLIAASADNGNSNNDCVYNIYVKTGAWLKSGTDSKISFTFSDSSSQTIAIPNLESWGLMGPKHHYYERDNLDIFTGKAPCIDAPICRLNLTSDGSGHHHGWYCEYVQVTLTGVSKKCETTAFYVERWLATDAPPYELTAVLDECGKIAGGEGRKEVGGWKSG